MMRKIQLFALLCTLSFNAYAQTAREVGVELLATLKADSSLQLSWLQQSGSTRYQVYELNSDGKSWDRIADLSGADTLFVDTTYKFGTRKEYRVARTSSNYTGFDGNGYMIAGFGVPPAQDLGNVIMVIENTYKSTATSEVESYITQLQNEGFSVYPFYVSSNDNVAAVKDSIFQRYKQFNSGDRTMIFLLGRVPVPYSGNYRPDGHPDHTGAWPADLYYGAFDISFTDATVNNTQATFSRHHNVPNDGKFDLSRYNTSAKSLVEYVNLPVGRVDLTNMPAFGNDTQLIKRYIQKALAFRTGERKPELRSLVDDNFGYFGSEAFASGGYRNGSTFSGRNIVSGDYRTEMSQGSYLMSYGCGGGTYTSCQGVSTSNDFVNDSLLNPLTLMFGSYYGDWDNTNNFLRAPLASKGWGLASVWSGRPYWMVHPCAHGAPLADAALITYNTWGVYNAAGFQAGVHVALMGDPTLRMFHVDNVRDFEVITKCAAAVDIKWGQISEIADSVVIESVNNGAYKTLQVFSAKDSMVNLSLYLGKNELSIRYLKLLESASGSWWQYGARHHFEVNLDTIKPIKSITTRVPDKYCMDSLVSFTDSGMFGAEVLSRWFWNDSTHVTAFGEEILVPAKYGQKVFLTRTNTNNGCIFRDSVVFNIEDLNTVILGVKPTQYCLNTPYTFKDSGVSSNSVRNIWTIEQKQISREVNDTVTFSWNKRGYRTVYFEKRSDFGCTHVDSFTVWVDAPNKPSIDVVENPGRIGDTIRLKSSIQEREYIWNSQVSTSDAFEFVADKNEHVIVLQLKDSAGCISDTAQVSLQFVVNGTNTRKMSNVMVYPNPFADFIEISGKLHSIERVLMRDASGRVVHILEGDTVKGRIDTRSLPHGTYILEISQENSSEVITVTLLK